MTTFNEAVQVAEAAHALTLRALDKALLILVNESNITATRISMTLRGRVATGDLYINEEWVSAKLTLAATRAVLVLPNGKHVCGTPESIINVITLRGIHESASVILDAVHEGLLSEDG